MANICTLLWLCDIEEVRPDRWDIIDGAVSIGGMALIDFAPRGEWLEWGGL